MCKTHCLNIIGAVTCSENICICLVFQGTIHGKHQPGKDLTLSKMGVYEEPSINRSGSNSMVDSCIVQRSHSFNTTGLSNYQQPSSVPQIQPKGMPDDEK